MGLHHYEMVIKSMYGQMSRYFITATCIKDRYIYVFGGGDYQNEPVFDPSGDFILNDVLAEVYDIKLNEWKPIRVSTCRYTHSEHSFV
jgi:hypothetical protein